MSLFETVASAILADVEPGFQPGGNRDATRNGSGILEPYRDGNDFSGRPVLSILRSRATAEGGQDAALYGRPGGPPLPGLAARTLRQPTLVE